MDWKDLGKQIAGYGLPLLGGALGGPGGAAIGSLVASALGLGDNPEPSKISVAVAGNPELVVKLRELELKHAEVLTQAAYDHEKAIRQAESADLAEVNETMRYESKSEHMPQWFWRPYNGILFGTTMFGVYFVLPLVDKDVPDVPFEAWAAWGAILGVASWWRGKQKYDSNSNGNAS